MSSRRQVSPSSHNLSPTRSSSGHRRSNYYSNESSELRRSRLIDPYDEENVRKPIIGYGNNEYQRIAVEINKDAEIGMVVGKVGDEDWVFIDEILANGMIETHGVLKEGDYLLQAGSYSLENISLAAALVLIERAYDEGRNSLTLVAARLEKKKEEKKSVSKRSSTQRDRPISPTNDKRRSRQEGRNRNKEKEADLPPAYSRYERGPDEAKF